MLFKIQSKTLLAKLTALGKVIPNKTTMPIMANFLMELHDDTLTITASDQENTIMSRVKVQDVEGSGKFCLDAKRLIASLKAMPDNMVAINVNDNDYSVKVTYTRGEYDLMANNGNDYPIKNDYNDDEFSFSYRLPSSIVLSGLDKVDFAVSTNPLRPQMGGVYWDVKPDSITFVATDSCKLAKYRTTQASTGVEYSFIMPIKTANLLRGIIDKDATVGIKANERNIIFFGEDYIIRASRIVGKYPDYNRVIPTANQLVTNIERDEFMETLNRVSLFAEASKLVKMHITSDEIEMTAKDASFNVGAKESVPCSFNGSDFNIGFNAEYLSEIFGSLTHNNIRMTFDSPSRPALIIPSENDEYGELTLLIMPVKIDVDK